jgi:MOSC domain-containing protein YiiM
MNATQLHAVQSAPSIASAGRVEAIYIAAEAAAPMRRVERCRAIAGLGLEGDRYFDGAGTFSQTPGTGRHLTLIDAAALASLEAEHGIRLRPEESRRNVITSGMNLLDLIGKRFWVGDVLCEGMRECPPCAHLESLTQPGVLRGLAHSGGLRAEIRSGGLLRMGDPIRLAEDD